MSFPLFFLVHLLVKVKYPDGFTVSANSTEVPLAFFLTGQFFPLLQSLLQCPGLAFSQLKRKKPINRILFSFSSTASTNLLKYLTHKWHPSLSRFIPLYFLYFLFFSDLCVQSAILPEHFKFTLGDRVDIKRLHQFLSNAIFKYKHVLDNLSNTKTQV